MRLPDTSRRIVVDTNVARSASESQHPISDACRQVLQTIIEKQHRVVLTATQKEEWQKHKSAFTRGWLVQMASKKLWHPLKPEPDSGITDRIYQLECTAKARREMLKDAHLLENALATDHAIVSQETNVLALFIKHAQPLQIPRPVAWVNPVESPVACIAWLEKGADAADALCVPAGI
jgi:predicted nucleic acid-binding protein